MSIETPIFLSDLIRLVLADMSLSVTPIFAQGEKGYNVEMERIANRDLPCICYDIEQSSTLVLQNTGKAYLQYSPTFLLVDKGDLDNLDDAQTRVNQMRLLAAEFFQRFQRLEAFANFPDNENIQPDIDGVVNINDTWMSGVYLNFTFTYDPKFPTPSC